MKYQGVDVDHPRIQEYAKNMAKQGRTVEEIAKVVGIPHEVAEKYKREVEREKKNR